MIFFPAIDLFGSNVVRLTKGNFSKKKDYELSPFETAKNFLKAGCTHVHIVDLEGAKEGRPCHLDVLEKISSLGMFVQYGGGLRSEANIRDALSAGADRVMIGSLLFKNDGMPYHIASKFGPAAMPAIDVRAGKVVHSGWLSETNMSPKEALTRLRKIGFSFFLVTNTDRDGMMSGIDPELYRELTEDKNDIVAAGGITTVNDIISLNNLGAAGVIIGKSLYEGGITISDALKALHQEGNNRLCPV